MKGTPYEYSPISTGLFRMLLFFPRAIYLLLLLGEKESACADKQFPPSIAPKIIRPSGAQKMGENGKQLLKRRIAALERQKELLRRKSMPRMKSGKDAQILIDARYFCISCLSIAPICSVLARSHSAIFRNSLP